MTNANQPSLMSRTWNQPNSHNIEKRLLLSCCSFLVWYKQNYEPGIDFMFFFQTIKAMARLFEFYSFGIFKIGHKNVAVLMFSLARSEKLVVRWFVQ